MPTAKNTNKSRMGVFERPPGALYTALAAEYAQSTPNVGKLLEQQQRHRAELRKRRKDRSLTSSDSIDPPVRRPPRRWVEVADEELSPDDSISQVLMRRSTKTAKAPKAPEAVAMEKLATVSRSKSTRRAVKPDRQDVTEPRQKGSSKERSADHSRGKRSEGYSAWARDEARVKSRKPVYADRSSLTSTTSSSSSSESLPLERKMQSHRPTATKEIRKLRSEIYDQVRRIERLTEKLDRAQEQIDNRDAAIELFKAKASCIEALWEDIVSLEL